MKKLATLVLFGLLTGLATASIPNEMRFQGKLAGEDAGPVDLTITLYDAPVGGSVLFSETHTNTPLTNGVFSISVGSIDADGIDDDALDAAQVWIGVAVDGGAELTPRNQVLTVPLAWKSSAAERLVSPNGFGKVVDVSSGHDISFFDSIGNEEVRFNLNGYFSDPVLSMFGNGIETFLVRSDNGDGGSLLRMRDGSRTTLTLEADVNGGSALTMGSSANVTAVELVATEGGSDGGELNMYEDDGSLTVNLDGQETDGAVLNMYNSSEVITVEIDSHESGAAALRLGDGTRNTIEMDADYISGGAFMQMRDDAGTLRAEIDADDSSSGVVRLFNALGNQVISLATDQGGNDGWITVNDRDGSNRVQLLAFDSSGGQALLRDSAGNQTVRIYAENPLSASDSGAIYLRAGTSTTLEMHGDWAGSGQSRIITDVVEIQGGADLSEQFDVTSEIEPGMVVSIDPHNPGKLVRSSNAYDRTVAGVVSGAGGVRPGFLMGQEGSIADGAHPVALTGRVWVHCDASTGAIQPGDLLTTSGTPGHAMKADDFTRTQGAVLGKAMTSLESGRGLVLVLVSLQ